MHFSSDSQHLKHCRQENFSEWFTFLCRYQMSSPMLIKYAVVNVLRHLVSRIQDIMKTIRKEVSIMPQNYTPEFKKKIVRLHEEEGRTYKSITAEYGVSKASISK